MLKKTLAAIAVASFALPLQAAKVKDVTLNQLGRYTTGVFDDGAAEIVAYGPQTFRLFVINASENRVDILDIFDPTDPMKIGEIDVTVIEDEDGAIEEGAVGGVNSVAVSKSGLVGVAVENDNKQMPGWAAFFDTDGTYLNHVEAGALPDAITFTPNSSFALTANEGEPNDFYTVDPEGSITVVDLRDGVLNATASHADFTAFNNAFNDPSELPDGMRAPRWAEPGEAFSLAQDLEPEFIATSHDSRTAWVTLQENNGLAVVDIRSATVTELVGLGKKDHSIPGNGLDASNRDDAINIKNWPVLGTYMPDSIFAYRTRGKTYLVTANEGDGREYIYKIGEAGAPPCESPAFVDDDECVYTDESRVGDDEIELDPAVFTDPTLQENENLGRIKMLNTEGNLDSDDKYEEIHTFGARSISIWRPDGTRVFDTGDTMEQVTADALTPDFNCFNDAKNDPELDPEDCSDFNSTNDENQSFDNRSDDKGPEPEGVVVGKVKGRYYAFVGLERVGGIMIFDVTRPEMTRYVDYINNRDFSVEDVEAEDAGDLGPEGLVFIKADDSPTGIPLLVVGNEVSGSTTIYEVIAK
jgi:hypothetical protein